MSSSNTNVIAFSLSLAVFAFLSLRRVHTTQTCRKLRFFRQRLGISTQQLVHILKCQLYSNCTQEIE